MRTFSSDSNSRESIIAPPDLKCLNDDARHRLRHSDRHRLRVRPNRLPFHHGKLAGSAGFPMRRAAGSGPRVACFAFQKTNLRRIDCSYFHRSDCSCLRRSGCSCSTLTIVVGNFPLTTVPGNFALTTVAGNLPPAASLALRYSWNSSFRCRTSASHYRCSCKRCHRARHTYCRWQFCRPQCFPRLCSKRRPFRLVTLGPSPPFRLPSSNVVCRRSCFRSTRRSCPTERSDSNLVWSEHRFRYMDYRPVPHFCFHEVSTPWPLARQCQRTDCTRPLSTPLRMGRRQSATSRRLLSPNCNGLFHNTLRRTVWRRDSSAHTHKRAGRRTAGSNIRDC